MINLSRSLFYFIRITEGLQEEIIKTVKRSFREQVGEEFPMKTFNDLHMTFENYDLPGYNYINGQLVPRKPPKNSEESFVVFRDLCVPCARGHVDRHRIVFSKKESLDLLASFQKQKDKIIARDGSIETFRRQIASVQTSLGPDLATYRDIERAVYGVSDDPPSDCDCDEASSQKEPEITPKNEGDNNL